MWVNLVFLFAGAVLGFVGSLIVAYVYDSAITPKLIFEEDFQNPHINETEGYAFYHVKVINSLEMKGLHFRSRRPAYHCRASIRVKRAGTNQVVASLEYARWPQNPEPHLIGGARLNRRVLPIKIFDPGRYMKGRRGDIYPADEGERIDLLIKFRGENQCYLFSDEFYREDYERERVEIPEGEHDAEVTVWCEGKPETAVYRIDNLGTDFADLTVRLLREGD